MDQWVTYVLCSQCNNPLSHQQNSCDKCGLIVSTSEFDASSSELCQGTCDDGTICGGPLNSNMRFCSNCGSRNPKFGCQLTSSSGGVLSLPLGNVQSTDEQLQCGPDKIHASDLAAEIEDHYTFVERLSSSSSPPELVQSTEVQLRIDSEKIHGSGSTEVSDVDAKHECCGNDSCDISQSEQSVFGDDDAEAGVEGSVDSPGNKNYIVDKLKPVHIEDISEGADADLERSGENDSCDISQSEQSVFGDDAESGVEGSVDSPGNRNCIVDKLKPVHLKEISEGADADVERSGESQGSSSNQSFHTPRSFDKDESNGHYEVSKTESQKLSRSSKGVALHSSSTGDGHFDDTSGSKGVALHSSSTGDGHVNDTSDRQFEADSETTETRSDPSLQDMEIEEKVKDANNVTGKWKNRHSKTSKKAKKVNTKTKNKSKSATVSRPTPVTDAKVSVLDEPSSQTNTKPKDGEEPPRRRESTTSSQTVEIDNASVSGNNKSVKKQSGDIGSHQQEPEVNSENTTKTKNETSIESNKNTNMKNRVSESSSSAGSMVGSVPGPTYSSIVQGTSQVFGNIHRGSQGRDRMKNVSPALAHSKISVRFHVMMKISDFNFKADDKVLIMFDQAVLGGWNSEQHIMAMEKQIDDKYILLNVNVEFVRPLLTTYTTLYKYVVLTPDRKFHYEYIPSRNPGITENRRLIVDLERLKRFSATGSHWEQYDGVMSPEPPKESLIGTFKSLFFSSSHHKRFTKQTKMAALAMLPSWDDLSITSDKMHVAERFLLQKIDQVCFCFNKLFVDEYSLRDPTKLKEVLREYVENVIKRLEQQIASEEQRFEFAVNGRLRLAYACCVVYLEYFYNINLTPDQMKTIFEACLIHPNESGSQCSDYEQLQAVYFVEEAWRREIAKALCSLIWKDTSQFSSLLAIPLYHFLNGDCKPFERAPPNANHRNADWWGLGTAQMDDYVKRFKQVNVDKMPLKYYLDRLSPLFTADYLIPRTLLAVMSFKHLPIMFGSGKFPPHVCLANVCYFILNGFELNENFASLLGIIKSKLEADVQPTESDLCDAEALQKKMSEVKLCFLIAKDPLKEICSKSEMKHFECFVTIVQIYALIISSVQKIRSLLGKSDKQTGSNKCYEGWQLLITSVQKWLNFRLRSRMVSQSYQGVNYDDNELKIYGKLMEISFFDKETHANWKKEIDKYITSRLKDVTGELRVHMMCCVKSDLHGPEVEDCFSRAAFQVFEDSTQAGGDYSFMFDAAKNHGKEAQLRKLLCVWFEKAWPADDRNQDTILKHILTWKSFARFLNLFYGKSGIDVLLSESCCEKLGIAMSVFEKVVDDLLSGAIFVSTFDLLNTNSTGFINIFNLVEKTGSLCVPESGIEGMDSTSVLLKVITWRQKELESFKELHRQVLNFLTLCHDVKCDEIEEIKNKVRFELDLMPFNSFCKPCLYTMEAAKRNVYMPSITYFKLDQSSKAMMYPLMQLQSSVIFKRSWEKSLKLLQNDSLNGVVTMAQVVSNVWQTSVNKFNQLRGRINSAEVTFAEIDDYMNLFGNLQNMERELKQMCSSEEVAIQRCTQIDRYRRLSACSEGAKVMLALGTSFGLTGNFGQVKLIASLVEDKRRPLQCITAELYESGNALKEITKSMVHCLEIFVRNKPLVQWFRETLKGPKEVKVLVDLAMISAQGGGDLEVHRVSCLHAAATGYAPLIYDMRPDMGFKEFLPLCQAVWKALEVDCDLPTKFRDTARLLDWLKQIEKSHSAVEVNALAEARAVNDGGIYTVGNFLERSDQELTLDKVLRLKVRRKTAEALSAEQQSESWQEMSLQQLNDLQSKLMLVAGKALDGKEQVDQFVETLDGITRLGNLYLRICNAGCTLFQHWKAIFYCNVERSTGITVKFGRSSEKTRVLKGRSSGSSDGVLQDLRDLCTFLEECLIKWLDHISKMRTEAYYLNNFTTEQLVILQNEIAKVNSSNKSAISPHVYPLISCIRKNCSLKDLSTAMRLAFEELKAMDSRAVERNTELLVLSDTVEVDSTEEVNTLEKEQLEELTEALFNSGYTETLAKAAIKAVGLNKEEAIMWCIEHEDEFGAMDVDDKSSDESSGDEETRDKIDDETSMLIAHKDLHLETTKESMNMELFNKMQKIKGSLLYRLRELWNVFQQEMNTSVADYLSLFHLGLFLKHIAQLDGVKLNRPMPVFLKKNKPNLIVCSEAEILRMVMSLYMFGNGAGLPLPGTDEVLVCHSATTVEDVELLWQRMEGDARNNWHGKIYTLVHAELLDYDVSHKVEQSLEKYCHALNDMRLVIVCCREMEDRCHMISALNRYRVKATPSDLTEVKQYLKNHFKVADARRLTRTAAACVDAESCFVRVVKSHRAGVGKTLKIKRLVEQLRQLVGGAAGKNSILITIPLHCRSVNQSIVLNALSDPTLGSDNSLPRIIHIDIAHEVLEGVDNLLFNLLVLGSISDRAGHVWTRSPSDLYVIETMPLMQREATRSTMQQKQHQLQYVHHIFELLPTLTCWSPKDSLAIIQGQLTDVKSLYTDAAIEPAHDQMMDEKEFKSPMFQRPFQYLQRFNTAQELRNIQPNIVKGTAKECIEVLLRNCKIKDPSWSELRHFVNFLNVQLQSCEQSIFCSEAVAPDLPGFLNFVVQFMLQMSKDFAMRSLVISEETPEVAMSLLDQPNEEGQDILDHYALERHWETNPHPYLFFNADGTTFTFMGFLIDLRTGYIMESTSTGLRVLEPHIGLPRSLQDGLLLNRVNLSEDFNKLTRIEKIAKMCYVMGIEMIYDPDPTYELTADNVMKMMAIYMRFRCGIPVIVMGETGCGKTRLIKFMCDLWKPPGADVVNMILMKVHGGTSADDIVQKVNKAVERARYNRTEFPDIQTVLFFDEANTTEHIGLIKEIMCDRTIRGLPLDALHRLNMIAACNPYRKHSDAMIDRLEHAGLGYHVDAKETVDKLGRIPMRRLVYRVQALPQSLLPLVWDFGQLSTDVERLYIRQMVNRCIRGNDELRTADQKLSGVASNILAASQEFMREQKDESSFVSLRDVDRTLQVTMWFYEQRELFELIDAKEMEFRRNADDDSDDEDSVEDDNDDDDDDDNNDYEVEYEEPDEYFRFTRSLILALGVCYHACLEKRKEFREFITPYFTTPCSLSHGSQTILQNISWCQDVFLDEIEIRANIAKNQALKENVFMMVICIELRIPLFLVGKPGSSKSLAKTIVSDAMQGERASSPLYRALKSVHMISYQCSPLSTPEGIVGTFSQCAELQKKKDLNKFVSVVVLDEVGLAEDSPRMPLKTLHPLLEDGCEGDDEPLPYKKVGFIGISNWALDPAKMNRGILVQRGVPDEQELEQSAKGICGSNEIVGQNIKALVKPMAKAYLELYNSALEIREFFGLRDFYSVIKMVCGFATQCQPSWHELQHAVMRNFGGLDTVKPLDVFKKHLKHVMMDVKAKPGDPKCDPASLIYASLSGDHRVVEGIDRESRYLLILTENYAALGILQQELLHIQDAIIIFGSSFPRDQEYTQVCRNINRIKVCMETGQTVILLNLENLYESLYDALNQYYVWMGGQRFVDLGLGTHRVKCRVHQNFRLIVVAEKKVVIEKFPIPLINRLEKHFLAMDTMLTAEQRSLSQRLQVWAEEFCKAGQANHLGRRVDCKLPQVGDVFIGYHADTAASVVLQVCRSFGEEDIDDEEVLTKAKGLLLSCATPESIVRLSGSTAAAHYTELSQAYFADQCHESFTEFIVHTFLPKPTSSQLMQITTHSHLLLRSDVDQMAELIGFKKTDVVLQLLLTFDTEQQFCKMLKEMFSISSGSPRLLILQCDSGDVYADLIACARYNITNEFSQSRLREAEVAGGDDDDNDLRSCLHIALVIQLPRIAGGCFVGFQGGRWSCHHIDDLHPSSDPLPPLASLQTQSVSTLFMEAVKHVEMAQEPDVDEKMNVDEDMDVDRVEENQDVMDMEEYEKAVDNGSMGIDVAVSVRQARERDAREGLRYSRRVIAGEEAGVESGPEVLNVDSIILKCVHPALVMLKDSDECRQRSSERLALLLEILNENKTGSRAGDPVAIAGDCSLMAVLRRRIALLLQDKENTVMDRDAAANWLSKEAASFQSINQAGFFRKAVWQYLETRVTPILAGVLAFADTNKNLDTLGEALKCEMKWIVDLWLELLANADVTILKYSDLQSAMRRSELTEFEVRTIGSAGSCPMLPFSYVIKKRVDALVFTVRSNQQLKTTMLTYVNDLLDNNSLGKILLKAAETCGGRGEIVKRYIHDFVRLSYKSRSEHVLEEFELVTKDIQLEAKEQLHQAFRASETMDGENVFEFNTEDISIPGVHLAFDVITSRLNLFGRLAQTFPDSVSLIAKCQNAGDLPLDLRSLIFLIEWLAPKKDELDKAESRRAWSNRVRTMSHLVHCLLDSVSLLGAQEYQERHKQCSFMWNRICGLQLFIMHVCSTESREEKISVRRCMPLWNMLGDKTDFKMDRSLLHVESFLKVCNASACEVFFGKGKCPQCKQSLEVPVKLPCKHVLCQKCVEELKQIDERRCPESKCDKPFDRDFKPLPQSDAKAMENFGQYKQRCNMFFMDLISRLCFSDTTHLSAVPPERAVVERLMGYITCKSKVSKKIEPSPGTKKMALFDDGLDPTPVVRSFLLQLLLRSDIEQVREYLQNFFDYAQSLLKAKDETMKELCLLCVQCLEDHYSSLYAQLETNAHRLTFIKNHLEESRKAMRVNPGNPDIVTLEAIAKSRFGLLSCARWLHQGVIETRTVLQRNFEVKDLYETAKRLCLEGKWTRVYLMRQIMRQYGMDILKQIGDNRETRWVIPDEVRNQQNDAVPDRFIVCGAKYKQLRELFTEVTLGKPLDALNEAIANVGGRADTLERDLLLIVYRTITSNDGQTGQQVPPEMVQQISNWCKDSTHIKNKDLAEHLIRNTLPDTLRSTPGNKISRDRALAEAIIHFTITIRRMNNNGLMSPLIALMKSPQTMQEAYLPTMPQDDLDDVKAAILESRAAGENPTFFQCPNGHPYVIGNCGRPAIYDTCRQCGQRIGGAGYVLDPANRPLDQTDNTPKGHVLGAPHYRQPTPERDMSSASTAILRLLLHMSMFLGATENPQQVSALIQPALRGDIVVFLWQHMLFDLEAIHVAIGRSIDDVLVLVHIMLVQAVQVPHQNFRGDLLLATKPARRTWENAFVNAYIAPVMQTANDQLQRANDMIVNDDGLGKNVLMRMLYEVETESSPVQSIVELPALWRYREQISIQHAQMSLQNIKTQANTNNAQSNRERNKRSPYPVLALFFREEYHLQCIRLLPNIVRLHRLLTMRFNRCIDLAEATSLTIGEFLDTIREDNVKQEFRSLINDFATAWNLVHTSLINYAYDHNGRTLPADYAQQTVDMNTCLAVLLPALRGYGVCSVALVCFICRTQNEFLEQYSQIKAQKLEQSVGIFDATNAHLVSFNRDRDLHPIVLANCNYSLECGKGTCIEYDYKTMEKQVEERFIEGRPRLSYQCDFILFREDTTNAAIFAELRHRVRQEPLQNVASIEKELHQKLTDVNDLLASLDIAIGFLVSIGDDPNSSLVHFMTKGLKMKLRPDHADIIHSCRLKHVEALWVLLSYLKACMQAHCQQDPFDGVEKYHEAIPSELLKTLKISFQHIDLECFSRNLYECILFAITIKQDVNAEDYVDNVEQQLNLVLDEYMRQKDDGVVIAALTDKRFPEELKVKHCVAVWRVAHQLKPHRRQR